MRTISSELNLEQRKPTRKPLLKLDVAAFGHPAAVDASALQWQSFAWERLTSLSDSTAVSPHSVAIPSDGSVCRLRNASGTLYFQRVTSPSGASDWSAWSSLGSVPSGHPVAIIARGSELIAFADDGVNLYRRQSSDSGATWAAWVSMSNTRPCERGIAAAYKSNGDCAVVHASDVNDPTSLYIQKRVSGSWSTGLGQISGDFPVSALALYHDGDWNMLALMLDGSCVRLARGIYGDGHQYTAGTFSGWEFINSYRARVDYSGQLSLRQWETRGRKKTPTYYEMVSAINQQRAVDNLGVDAPCITFQSSLGAVFSFAKDNQPWFYRLRPGTEFKDADWYKALPLETLATCGLALAADSAYLYASAPNQVWRTALPGNWSPPTAGSGAGTDYTIPAAHLLAVREKVEPLSAGSLEVILDNSSGYYNAAGTGSASLLASLKRGSQVTLSIGYRSGASQLLSQAGKYFIERLGYARKAGQAHYIIQCVDAWGLLQNYAFNRPVEWNAAANDLTVYALIEKVIQAVGGTLSYRSRSTLITSIYPHIEISAGHNGALVLRKLLSLVPDVIYFEGLAGCIVYPQPADTPTYKLRSP